MNFELICGSRRNSELLYITEQKMLYRKKSEYKGVTKYQCRQKSCKSRVNLLSDGSCVLSKGYVDHNHGDEETTYRELKALNLIKQDCQDMAETLGGTKTNISTIRKAFRRTCER